MSHPEGPDGRCGTAHPIGEVDVRVEKVEAERDRWKAAWQDLWERTDDEAEKRAEARVQSTYKWYAARLERLKEWARAGLSKEMREQFFCILANDHLLWDPPPSYAQILQREKIRADLAEEKLARIGAEKEDDDA
jgi:DNA-directed RNA polymerase